MSTLIPAQNLVGGEFLGGVTVYAKSQGLQENPFLVDLDNKGGVEKIEKLQTHPKNKVYLKALRILENHIELDNIF